MVDSYHVLAGNLQLLAERGISTDELVATFLVNTYHKLQEEGKTIVAIVIDGTFEGILGIADKLKDQAVSAVTQLHALGLRIAMLTGDNRQTAEVIAREAGISEVIAEVLPTEKLLRLRQSKTAGRLWRWSETASMMPLR